MRLAILPLLLLGGAATAAPDAAAPVTTAELQPRKEDLFRKLAIDVERKKDLKPEDFLRIYAQAAAREAPPREAAICAYLHGVALDLLQRDREAQTEYERALQLFPSFPDALLGLAHLAEQARAPAQARKLVENALAVAPKEINVLVKLGELSEIEGKLGEARDWYKRANAVEPHGRACVGLARVNLKLRESELDPKARRRCEEEALHAAEAWLALEPGNGKAHLHLAQRKLELGLVDEAIAALESAYAERIQEGDRFACLELLVNVHMSRGEPEKVKACLQRLSRHKAVTGDYRTRIEKMIRDLDEKGTLAFGVWRIEELLAILTNEGKSAEERCEALRAIVRAYEAGFGAEEPALLELAARVHGTIVSALVGAPPALVKEILMLFRVELRHPRLASLVVHFLYPNEGKDRTTSVRVEATRTLAAVANVGAIPALLHSLKDDAPDVLREVDKSLSLLTGERSPVGESIAPLTDDEKRVVRRSWLGYAHGEAGTEKLVEALKALRECVPMRSSTTREIRTLPVANHVIDLVLDNDLRLPAWLEAYRFLADYLDREFRPLAKRGTPVDPSERDAIVAEVLAFWNPAGAAAPPSSPAPARGPG
ncbi:MAG: tetratricopeptide repeat protein, partial [Planctomycetota bacterium]